MVSVYHPQADSTQASPILSAMPEECKDLGHVTGEREDTTQLSRRRFGLWAPASRSDEQGLRRQRLEISH